MDITQSILEVKNNTSQLLERWATQSDKWDQKVNDLVNYGKSKIDGFIADAEKRFIKGMYYKELDTPIEIPGTGQYSLMLDDQHLDETQIEYVSDKYAAYNKLKNPYEYSSLDDYSPQIEGDSGNLVNCFANFNIGGFPNIPCDAKYLILCAEVYGSTNYYQYVPIDVIHYSPGNGTWWIYPDHYDQPLASHRGVILKGRNWYNYYLTINILKFETSTLGYTMRIINRGNRIVNIFGLGIIYK